MSRVRRLSLRARMLVMLVGVTIVLLLIMGTISTYLLSRRVDVQTASIDKHLETLATALATQPTLAQGHLTGYAAVEVPLTSQLGVVQLTQGKLTGQLATAISQQLHSSSLTAVSPLLAQGRLNEVRALLISRGCTQFPELGCKPFDLDRGLQVASHWVPASQGGRAVPGGRALLFVGQPLTATPDQLPGFIIAELITGTALVALLALGGEWLIGRGLIPLDEMTRTANEITSRGDLTARMPDADDQTEIGRLGSSINTMLDRIQHAFSSRLRSEQKVREFAADASHELRTPLTTIRGYAELYRQGALGPDQLPNAMRRIEQEAERMSALVAELLELARLDRTSSLDLTESDLAGIVRDAVADTIAVEPQRPVRAEAPPRLVAVVDEARIRQVLANLLGNVRAHTPVTTPVAVRLGQITGGILLEVADAGPGMPAPDAARAFDRFHRAADRASGEHAEPGAGGRDPGRGMAAARTTPYEQLSALAGGGAGSGAGGAVAGAANTGAANAGPAGPGPAGANGARPGTGRGHDRVSGSHPRPERTSGSGLGLSIVQAIANAHGGRATLESLPGKGTKVRVWLPVRIVP
jgi:signal transduction histidine kinase